MIPLLGFSVMMVERMAKSRREVEERRLVRTAVGMVNTLDREFAGSIRVLESLAQSEFLAAGDMEGFRAHAARVLESQPSWVSVGVADLTGQMLMNTALTPGTPLPVTREMVSFRQAVEGRKPVVGRLAWARGPEVRAYPIRVPVIYDGQLKYILSATSAPHALQSMVQPQPHTAGEWSRTIVDSNQVVVARTRDPEKFVGRSASAEFVNATSQGTEGIFRATTLDGLKGCSGYAKSEVTNWICVVIAPNELVDGPVISSVMFVAAAGGLLLLVSVGVAVVFSRRISRSIASVARGAEQLSRGGVPSVEPSGVLEVRQLADALTRSADLLQRREIERSDLLVRAEAARQQAEAASRSKDEFLAMLGHELRNPLSPARHGISFLDQKIPRDDRELRPVVEVLDRQVIHMTRLVNDLLDASRISRGSIELHRQCLDLVRLVDNVVADHQPEFHSKHRSLVFIPPEDGQPMLLSGDRTRLSQSIANLLHNALKFTHPGGRVTLTLDRRDHTALLSVHDDGIGIEPGLISRLFAAFEQGPQQLSRSLGGLGLGLNLVRGFIELHGGRVEAHSDGPDRGSTFRIFLPLDPSLSLSASQPTRPSNPDSTNRRRVLLVEDMADTARMLRLILSHEGHDVRVAHTAADALRTIETFSPDVILCDIGLPDMDGFALCRQFRGSPFSAYSFIIALTGYGQADDIRMALEAGFDLHLTKPVDTATLKQIVSRGAPTPSPRQPSPSHG